jgi:hypothetical protein
MHELVWVGCWLHRNWRRQNWLWQQLLLLLLLLLLPSTTRAASVSGCCCLQAGRGTEQGV